MDHPDEVQHDTETIPTIAEPEAGQKHAFYIPSLDGIRAVSIAIVILSHAGLGKYIPGGLGVTVFFFLSGFLITTLLRKEENKYGHITLSKFYMRRVFRIFPPMYTALFLAIVFAQLGLLPAKAEFLPTLLQALHLTNYSEYIVDAPQIKGTGVLWSLAVEEHFYLLFPMLCFILLKPFSNRTRAAFLGGLCLLILFWRYYLVTQLHVELHRTYYCTDTRMDSILFGCIMGLFCNPVLDKKLTLSHWKSFVLLGISLATIGFTIVFRNDLFRETLRYTVQGIALYPIFYLAITQSESPLFRWLNYGPIRFLGVLSYSLYLVHHFILIATAHVLSSLSPMITGPLGVVIALAITLAIYHLVEQPSAKLRKKFQT